MINQLDYVRKNYIPSINEYLDGKIDLDTFATLYFSAFRNDSSLYGAGRRYPDEIGEILSQLFTDIDVADSDPEVLGSLFLPEPELKKLCVQYLEKLIQLAQ